MSAQVRDNQRAHRRLLSHCALVGRALKRRVPARSRLETAIGRDQARDLVEALAAPGR
jgi:hypothetical protein